MKLCRFLDSRQQPRIGLVAGEDDHVLDLTNVGIRHLTPLLESESLEGDLTELIEQRPPTHPPSEIQLLAPVEQQEVWAAGVTYLRSRTARMEESEFSANAYDRVYDAPRPELFFKAMPYKVVGPEEAVGIRSDAQWNVPEPELALVYNSRGDLVGYTIGNDMSSRDIEGENLLYLPQAKVYDASCALGPFIKVGIDEPQARQWKIRLQVERDNQTVFHGETSVDRIKRDFAELTDYLFRSQSYPHGVILLTGTGVVPGEDFTLQAEDRVTIEVDGIGRLSNLVRQV